MHAVPALLLTVGLLAGCVAGSVPAGSPGIPATTLPDSGTGAPQVAGVTYRNIDGGQNYFGRWTNSFTTDPSFFPIGVWAESFSDDAEVRAMIDEYQRIGINVFPEPYGMPAGINDYMKSKNMYTVGSGTTAMAASKTTDEPDWRDCSALGDEWPSAVGTCHNLFGTDGGPVSPASLQAWSDHVRRTDPTRPVYNQFTKAPRAGLGAFDPATGRPECEDWAVNVAAARDYFRSADIISYDWYILQTDYNPANCRFVWMQGDAVRQTRKLSDYQKPVWPFIGLTEVSAGDYAPTLAELNAEVWSSIVGGARGIQYFQHNFNPARETTRVLVDPRYTVIRAQITATNTQIRGLAPVINSPYADGLTRVVAGQVDTMSKGYGGSFYVFATSRQKAAQTVTFDVTALGNGRVDVLDEGRWIQASGGRFSDVFADQNAVHIYRFTPTA